MTDQDRLAAAKAHLDAWVDWVEGRPYEGDPGRVFQNHAPGDMKWLIGELKVQDAEILRLRGRLREVEWGCARYAEATELRCCPWCHYTDDVGHEAACQLAAELRSTSP